MTIPRFDVVDVDTSWKCSIPESAGWVLAPATPAAPAAAMATRPVAMPSILRMVVLLVERDVVAPNVRVPLIEPRPASPSVGEQPRSLGLAGDTAGLQAMGQGRAQLSSGADGQLGEDVFHVGLDRADRHEQRAGDLGIGRAVGGQGGHALLLRRQPAGVGALAASPAAGH